MGGCVQPHRSFLEAVTEDISLPDIYVSADHYYNLHDYRIIEDFPHIPVIGLHSSQASKIKKDIAEVTKEMEIVMEKEMEKRIEKCKKNGIKSHLKVITGLAAEEIMKVVKSQKTDLIVMAKRRKLKGIKGLLSLGSVSRKIVENTSCPVLMLDIEKNK